MVLCTPPPVSSCTASDHAGGPPPPSVHLAEVLFVRMGSGARGPVNPSEGRVGGGVGRRSVKATAAGARGRLSISYRTGRAAVPLRRRLFRVTRDRGPSAAAEQGGRARSRTAGWRCEGSPWKCIQFPLYTYIYTLSEAGGDSDALCTYIYIYTMG